MLRVRGWLCFGQRANSKSIQPNPAWQSLLANAPQDHRRNAGFLERLGLRTLPKLTPGWFGHIVTVESLKRGHRSAGIQREGADDCIYQDRTVAMVKFNSP